MFGVFFLDTSNRLAYNEDRKMIFLRLTANRLLLMLLFVRIC